MNINDILASWGAANAVDPYDWVNLEPENFDEALNDLSEDFPDHPLPYEVTAYLVSKLAGRDVPVNHPLIQNRNKYRKLEIDLGFVGSGGDEIITPDDVSDYMSVLKSAVSPEVWRGIRSDLSGVIKLLNRRRGKAFLTDLNGEPLTVVVMKDRVIFVPSRDEFEPKSYSFDGKRLDDLSMEQIASLIKSPVRVEQSELSKYIGGTLYGLLMGPDISILDLP